MAAPTEVTEQRLAQMLTDNDTIFQKDPDNETLIVPFENMMFFLRLHNGGMFSIHGVWRGDASAPEDQNRVAQWVQEMNSKTLVPKVYASEDTSGVWRLHTESNTVVPAGLNDEQLRAFIGVSFQASLFVVQQLEAEMPHLVVWPTRDGEEAKEGE